MEIYVVQPGDTIRSIADRFGVTVDQLIQDNGLSNPFDLVIGQTIVIAQPAQTHIVREGDTLGNIAEAYNVSLMQLLRNNPALYEKEFILPGEVLVISYPEQQTIATVGFTYPYINELTLRKTLPYLTYLSVFNYRSMEDGSIITYADDTQIVQLAKEYGTIPLAMLTTLSEQGESDINVSYKLLLNSEYQDIQINNLVNIVREKDYLGANVVFYYINSENEALHEAFLRKISERFVSEGLFLLLTINYQTVYVDGEVEVEQVDYSALGQYVDGIIFLQFIWGTNYNPPQPVSSIQSLRALMEYVVPMVPPNKILIGKPIIAYDWVLPYSPDNKGANSITVDAALALAADYNVPIIFDEISKTPFFNYIQIGGLAQHIVWSIDARSIQVLMDLIKEYDLAGAAIWNIMVYNQQLWTILTLNFNIIKLIPDNLS